MPIIERQTIQVTGNGSSEEILKNLVNYYAEERVLDIGEDIGNNYPLEKEFFKFTYHIPINSDYNLHDKNNSFDKSQNWIGYVLEIGKDSFTARIEDIDLKGAFEEAEFDLNDVEDEDKKLLKEGSAFYWSVGYEYNRGTKAKKSIIRFKRLPKLKQANIDAALDLANEFEKGIKWE